MKTREVFSFLENIFFANFVTCANFQNCGANFSKPRRNIDTMFSLNVAEEPRLPFAKN